MTTDFDRFVREQYPALVRLSWALTGSRPAAEDLAQESLSRLWPHWERVVSQGDPWPYLQRIAVNRATSWRRWHLTHPIRELAQDGSDDVSDKATFDVDGREQVRGWLHHLPPRQRAVIVLRYLCDLSLDQTAAVLGCSAGTVKSQTFKALKTLRTVRDSSDNTEEVTQ